MTNFYTLGMRKVSRTLKVKHLLKTGEASEGRSTGENALVGGAAAAPFLGLIGQKDIIHDPLAGAQGAQFDDFEALARKAREGDVLLTTKHKPSIWKHTMAPFTGSEFYHAQPVIGRRRTPDGAMGTTGTAGEWLGAFDDDEAAKAIKAHLETIPDEMAAAGYSDAVLLRPKGTTAAQRKAVGDAAAQRLKTPYGNLSALRAWAKDIFLPKIDALSSRGDQIVCEGNVCSTHASQALHEGAGVKVLAGKRAKDVMPADFLRSDQFELVGSHLSEDSKALVQRSPSWLRKARPYLARGALGAGLAGTTYALQEDGLPIVGAAAGLGGANALGSILAKKYSKRPDYEMPRVWDAVESGIADMGRNNKYNEVYRNFAKRRVPLLLAGGGLGLLGAKYLKDKVFSKEGEALNPEKFKEAWDSFDTKPGRTYEEHKHGHYKGAALDPSHDVSDRYSDKDKRTRSAISEAFKSNENYDMSFGAEPGIINNINKIAISLGTGSAGSAMASSIPAVKPPSIPKANAMAPKVKAPSIKPVGLSKSDMIKGQNKMDLGASVTSPMRRLQGSPL